MQTTPTLSPHVQRKHDAMVRRILDTAREIMREQGVAALSMQEIARRMDLRASSLYHYFPGKMEIYDALFRLGFELLGKQMDPVLDRAQKWKELARGSFESYFQFASEHPDLFQLCFERPVPGFTPSEESLRVSTQALQKAYQRAESFKDTMQTGLTTRQAVDLMIAMMHGITALTVANEPGTPAGRGRFGALIPAALEVLEKAWSQR